MIFSWRDLSGFLATKGPWTPLFCGRSQNTMGTRRKGSGVGRLPERGVAKPRPKDRDRPGDVGEGEIPTTFLTFRWQLPGANLWTRWPWQQLCWRLNAPPDAAHKHQANSEQLPVPSTPSCGGHPDLRGWGPPRSLQARCRPPPSPPKEGKICTRPAPRGGWRRAACTTSEAFIQERVLSQCSHRIKVRLAKRLTSVVPRLVGRVCSYHTPFLSPLRERISTSLPHPEAPSPVHTTSLLQSGAETSCPQQEGRLPAPAVLTSWG